MKNLFLLVIMLCVGFGLNAQSTTKQVVNTPIVFTAFGNATDTIKKGSATNVNDFFTVPVAPFAKTVMYKVNAVRTAGTYTKARFVLQKSLDNVVWENVDSVAFAGTGASQHAAGTIKTDIYRPLIRFKAYAYDTTQVVKYKYTILIDK